MTAPADPRTPFTPAVAAPRRRWVRRLSWGLSILFVLANGLAIFQSWTMTHYRRGARRGPRVEELSLGSKVWRGLFGVTIARPEVDSSPADLGLPFTTHQVSVEPGVTLELWRVPVEDSKGTVVALHGYADSKSNILPETAIFHDLGYEVVVVDFRGSGGSSGSHTSLGVEESRDLKAVWNWLDEEDQPRIIYGRSMGSVAALRAMAREGVKPAGAILESPFDRLSTAVARRCELAGAPRFPTTQLLLFWGGVQLGFNAFEHNPVNDARETTCPVLLLRGERDNRVHQEDLQAIADAIPHSPRVALIPNATHASCCQPDPVYFKDVLQRFLDSLQPTSDGK